MQNLYTEEFEGIGVYQILNKVNNKSYIGSTTMSFTKRMDHHRSMLRKGNHKNQHLQRAWNKYGEDNFEFLILEEVDVCCTLEVEQGYLDNTTIKYNINPLATGTPNLSKETIIKRSKTILKTHRKAIEYYFKVKNEGLSIEEVPEKYRKIVEFRLNNVIWNTGLTKELQDYSHLKVPKTLTKALRDAQKETARRLRDKAPEISVYSKEWSFLGKWHSPKDLEEWSLTEENNLPIKMDKVGNRRPYKYLSSSNIMKVANTEKTYKGLYFTTSEK